MLVKHQIATFPMTDKRKEDNKSEIKSIYLFIRIIILMFRLFNYTSDTNTYKKHPYQVKRKDLTDNNN